MGLFVERCARIQDTGAHVLLIHHTGKDELKGARGSSALLGAVDVEVEITKDAIRARKESERDIPRPKHFKIEGVVIGVNREGNAVSAACATLGDAGDFQTPLTRAERDYFDAFEAAQEKLSAADDADQNPPLSKARWDEEADALIAPGERRGRSRQARND